MAADRVDLSHAKVPRTFEVPPSYWGAVLDPLTPAHVDDHPKKWEVYGDLRVKVKNGTTYFFMLSYDDRFAAGPTSDHRVYYRGSDNVALMRALEGAYEASQKNK